MERNEVIVGRTIFLRSILEESKPQMKAMLTSNEIKKTYMLPDFSSEEELDKYFYRLKAITENKDKFVYGIYLKDTLIGFLNEVDKKEDCMELGYFIDPHYWGHGYASEALMIAIEELFRIGINTVKTAYFEGNKASERVMQKCGMTLTGETEYIEYRGQKLKAIYYQIDKDNLIN